MSRRTGIGHTAWCAADHRCNLAEHRSESILVDLPGRGRAVLVRVRDDQGDEYAEIRVRVALAPGELAARRQLRTALSDLRALLTRTAASAAPRPAYRRPAA